MAAESEFSYYSCPIPLANIIISGWRWYGPSVETSKCDDARRVSATEQDSLPAEPARERHKRPAHGTLLAVRTLSSLPGTLINLPFCRYPNLYEVRLIPTKKDIAFVEYMDEGSATVAKDALHNYKLDGENKIKVSSRSSVIILLLTL